MKIDFSEYTFDYDDEYGYVGDRCNFCTLLLMKRLAAKRGVKVIMGRDEFGWITARYSDEPEPAASFMALTEHCVC